MEDKPSANAPAKAENKPAGILTKDDKRKVTMAVKETTTGVMNPIEYEQARVMANDLINAGALPSTIRNREQAMIMIVTGREMGMTPMEAIHDLYFVDGKLNIYGKATPAALRRAGWRIVKYDESKENECTATVENAKTGETITDTFTFEDAELSGFTKSSSGSLKFGWRQGANRKRKLRYGALSQIIHTYIPEVLSGVAGVGEYTEDYMEGQDAVAARAQEEGKAQKLADLQNMAEAEVSGENN